MGMEGRNGVVEVERDSVDVPGANASSPETLELVRRLPVRTKGWVWVRVKSKLCRKDSDWKRRFATLRGGVLLLDKLGRNASLQVQQDINDDWYTTFDLVHFRLETFKKRLTIELIRPDETLKVKVRLPNEESYNSWLRYLEKEFELLQLDPLSFKFVRQVGEGSMGKVYKVTREESAPDVPLAMKLLEKSFIDAHSDALRLAMDERAVLELVGEHPYVLGLRYAIETEAHFALITEFCERGDLSFFLAQRRQPLSEEKARILVAEVALGLDHLHSLGVVYRDLKTENVLLDKDGHVRIADFGLSKILARDKKEALMRRTDSVCGTTHYFAPEMLIGEGYSQSVDFWALGVLLHFVLTGRMPYDAENNCREEIIRKVRSEPAQISSTLSKTCRSFIDALLQRDLEKRLGRRGLIDLQEHEFFDNFDWAALIKREGPGIFEKHEETRRVHRMVDKQTSMEVRGRTLAEGQRTVPGFGFSIECFVESNSKLDIISSKALAPSKFTSRLLTKVYRTNDDTKR